MVILMRLIGDIMKKECDIKFNKLCNYYFLSRKICPYGSAHNKICVRGLQTI